MTRVLVTTTVPKGNQDYFRKDADRLVQLLSKGHASCALHVTEQPEDADWILFVGSARRAMNDIRNCLLYRKHQDKCFVIHGGDEPLPTVPGIYASVPRRWYDPEVHRSGFYLRTATEGITDSFAGLPATKLFSFVGAGANHPVRSAILRLRCADAYLLDSALQPAAPAQARERFVRSLNESQFVLCPRGGGTSSFRLFETMMAGRVPVIVSDDWVEPVGPDWTSFSLRVAERDVLQIPRILSDRAGDGPAMGLSARAAWEKWFAPETAGPTIVSWLQQLEAKLKVGGRRQLPWRMTAHAAADAAYRAALKLSRVLNAPSV